MLISTPKCSYHHSSMYLKQTQFITEIHTVQNAGTKWSWGIHLQLIYLQYPWHNLSSEHCRRRMEKPGDHDACCYLVSFRYDINNVHMKSQKYDWQKTLPE